MESFRRKPTPLQHEKEKTARIHQSIQVRTVTPNPAQSQQQFAHHMYTRYRDIQVKIVCEGEGHCSRKRFFCAAKMVVKGCEAYIV